VREFRSEPANPVPRTIIHRTMTGQRAARYFRVEFSLLCPAGHRSKFVRFYRATTCDEAEKRFPHMLPCSFCSPKTLLTGLGHVEFDCMEISELEFSELGGTLEPEVI